MNRSFYCRCAALVSGAAALALPGAASAAALEHTVPSFVRIFFEDGTYGELGLSYAAPDLDGKGANVPAALGGGRVDGNTGDLLKNYWSFSTALKGDFAFNDRLSWLLTFDQPYTAQTQYRQGSFPAGFSYAGTEADLDTYQLTAGLAYDATPNVKLYGGLRAQRMDATAALPILAGYRISADDDWGYGGYLGAAYHRPEIGLRVALTYASKISHALPTTESSTLFGSVNDTTDVDTPQSVTLEAQTGVAADTLVFGSVRWVDWSEFAIAPDMYADITELVLGERRPLVDYPKDWWTYNLGVARQFTPDFAASFSVTYEPQVNEVLTTLGPVDGRTTLNLGASYEIGQATVSAGLVYGWLGDATNLLDTKYRDGTVVGGGLRIGYNF